MGRRLRAPLLGLVLLAGTGCDPDDVLGNLFGTNPQASADPETRIDEMARGLGLSPAGDGSYTYRSAELRAELSREGTVTFAGANEQDFTGPADWAMRADQDAPGAKAQLELLQATADLRREMSIHWFDDFIDRSLETLDIELISILESEHLSMRQRRAMIFDRWDDAEQVFESYGASTAESALQDIHRLEAEATRRTRAHIEAFVRRHLPVGSRDAYRNDELDQLNARRKSEVPFDPYEGQGVLG